MGLNDSFTASSPTSPTDTAHSSMGLLAHSYASGMNGVGHAHSLAFANGASSSTATLLPMPPKENRKVPVDLNTTFQARDSRSKEKCMRFFGEHRIPILVGAGSASKVGMFYGATLGAKAATEAVSGVPSEGGLRPAAMAAAGNASGRARHAKSASLDAALGFKGGEWGHADSTSTLSHELSSANIQALNATAPPQGIHTIDDDDDVSGQGHSTQVKRPSHLSISKNSLTEALLLSPTEPQSPCGQLQAAITTSRSIATGANLTPEAWKRRGSHGSVSSARDPSEADIGWLTWLQEIQHSGTATPAQAAKAESISQTFKRKPRPMSVDSLLSRAQSHAALSIVAAAPSSESSSMSGRAGMSISEEENENVQVSANGSSGSNINIRHSMNSSSNSNKDNRSSVGTTRSNARMSVMSAISSMSIFSRDSLRRGSTSTSHGAAAISQPILMSSGSLRKISAIFGEACPVDVPVQQIRRDGLWAMLMSNLPLCYFTLNLLKEQVPEILFFVLDAHDFEQTVFESNEDLQRAAQDLFALYLAKDALFEINVSHKVRRAVADGIQSFSLACFRRALQEMASLLEDAYGRFKATPYYSMMAEDLGLHAVVHSEPAARRVVELLRDAVPRDSPSLDDYRRKQVWAIRARLDILVEDRLTPYFVSGSRA
ncbi:hypothetical protein BC831DRAFT_441306 [Entophlyctis helioformis]|nr:hypothetical protein BC831DRAFT_441306 [Entophlyctis helioformis]